MPSFLNQSIIRFHQVQGLTQIAQQAPRLALRGPGLQIGEPRIQAVSCSPCLAALQALEVVIHLEVLLLGTVARILITPQVEDLTPGITFLAGGMMTSTDC
jgi:hypothetical protein